MTCCQNLSSHPIYIQTKRKQQQQPPQDPKHKRKQLLPSTINAQPFSETLYMYTHTKRRRQCTRLLKPLFLFVFFARMLLLQPFSTQARCRSTAIYLVACRNFKSNKSFSCSGEWPRSMTNAQFDAPLSPPLPLTNGQKHRLSRNPSCLPWCNSGCHRDASHVLHAPLHFPGGGASGSNRE